MTYHEAYLHVGLHAQKTCRTEIRYRATYRGVPVNVDAELGGNLGLGDILHTGAMPGHCHSHASEHPPDAAVGGVKGVGHQDVGVLANGGVLEKVEIKTASCSNVREDRQNVDSPVAGGTTTKIVGTSLLVTKDVSPSAAGGSVSDPHVLPGYLDHNGIYNVDTPPDLDSRDSLDRTLAAVDRRLRVLLERERVMKEASEGRMRVKAEALEAKGTFTSHGNKDRSRLLKSTAQNVKMKCNVDGGDVSESGGSSKVDSLQTNTVRGELKDTTVKVIENVRYRSQSEERGVPRSRTVKVLSLAFPSKSYSDNLLHREKDARGNFISDIDSIDTPLQDNAMDKSDASVCNRVDRWRNLRKHASCQGGLESRAKRVEHDHDVRVLSCNSNCKRKPTVANGNNKVKKVMNVVNKRNVPLKGARTGLCPAVRESGRKQSLVTAVHRGDSAGDSRTLLKSVGRKDGNRRYKDARRKVPRVGEVSRAVGRAGNAANTSALGYAGSVCKEVGCTIRTSAERDDVVKQWLNDQPLGVCDERLATGSKLTAVSTHDDPETPDVTRTESGQEEKVEPPQRQGQGSSSVSFSTQRGGRQPDRNSPSAPEGGDERQQTTADDVTGAVAGARRRRCEQVRYASGGGGEQTTTTTRAAGYSRRQQADGRGDEVDYDPANERILASGCDTNERICGGFVDDDGSPGGVRDTDCAADDNESGAVSHVSEKQHQQAQSMDTPLKIEQIVSMNESEVDFETKVTFRDVLSELKCLLKVGKQTGKDICAFENGSDVFESSYDGVDEIDAVSLLNSVYRENSKCLSNGECDDGNKGDGNRLRSRSYVRAGSVDSTENVDDVCMKGRHLDITAADGKSEVQMLADDHHLLHQPPAASCVQRPPHLTTRRAGGYDNGSDGHGGCNARNGTRDSVSDGEAGVGRAADNAVCGGSNMKVGFDHRAPDGGCCQKLDDCVCVAVLRRRDNNAPGSSPGSTHPCNGYDSVRQRDPYVLDLGSSSYAAGDAIQCVHCRDPADGTSFIRDPGDSETIVNHDRPNRKQCTSADSPKSNNAHGVSGWCYSETDLHRLRRSGYESDGGGSVDPDPGDESDPGLEVIMNGSHITGGGSAPNIRSPDTHPQKTVRFNDDEESFEMIGKVLSYSDRERDRTSVRDGGGGGKSVDYNKHSAESCCQQGDISYDVGGGDSCSQSGAQTCNAGIREVAMTEERCSNVNGFLDHSQLGVADHCGDSVFQNCGYLDVDEDAPQCRNGVVDDSDEEEESECESVGYNDYYEDYVNSHKGVMYTNPYLTSSDGESEFDQDSDHGDVHVFEAPDCDLAVIGHQNRYFENEDHLGGGHGDNIQDNCVKSDTGNVRFDTLTITISDPTHLECNVDNMNNHSSMDSSGHKLADSGYYGSNLKIVSQSLSPRSFEPVKDAAREDVMNKNVSTESAVNEVANIQCNQKCIINQTSPSTLPNRGSLKHEHCSQTSLSSNSSHATDHPSECPSHRSLTLTTRFPELDTDGTSDIISIKSFQGFDAFFLAKSSSWANIHQSLQDIRLPLSLSDSELLDPRGYEQRLLDVYESAMVNGDGHQGDSDLTEFSSMPDCRRSRTTLSRSSIPQKTQCKRDLVRRQLAVDVMNSASSLPDSSCSSLSTIRLSMEDPVQAYFLSPEERIKHAEQLFRKKEHLKKTKDDYLPDPQVRLEWCNGDQRQLKVVNERTLSELSISYTRRPQSLTFGSRMEIETYFQALTFRVEIHTLVKLKGFSHLVPWS